MKTTTSKRTKGNVIIEMALIFIPMTMAILSTTELSRGMWLYHTLTTAIKNGSRTASLQGADCVAENTTCPATVSNIASVIESTGVGLEPSALQLTLIADGVSYTCGSLAKCAGDATTWPPAGHNTPGFSQTISAVYSFHSVLSVLWPGGAAASINYLAEAIDVIQF